MVKYLTSHSQKEKKIMLEISLKKFGDWKEKKGIKKGIEKGVMKVL
jgi:hypothetical protein